MSILKLQIRVFRFDAKNQYNPSYPLCIVEYLPEWRLKDVLEHIPFPDFGYDATHLGLKINQIAIFENLLVSELVQRFSAEWVLEPLAAEYALKDLLMDESAILGQYQSFLQSAPFLSASEQSELAKYININFITPKKQAGYYGDGFFLYVRWLMTRYPTRAKDFLQSIAHDKYGVMHFVSLKNYLYPPSDRLDEAIYDLQKMLTHGSACPIANNTWAHVGKNLALKYAFPPKQTPPSTQAAFLIFNGYDKLFNSAPLLQSTRALLSRLKVEFVELTCCFDGGYWGRFGDLEKFLSAQAYNLALAHKSGATLLFCDEDSYANALYAKKILDESPEWQEKIQKILAPHDLQYHPEAQIAYLNHLLSTDFLNLEGFANRSIFNGFSTALFGGYHLAQSTNYNALFDRLSLKCHTPLFATQSYAHLLEIDMPLALKQSANIRYEAIDLGVDFLLTTSLSQFYMLDTLAQKASKLYQRDHDSTSLLFLPQLALLALGETNKQTLGLDTHANPFNFI
ncbi:DUF5644 domain-containing protein [Helicobacter bizzozeronii]|uniref:DUF5644 domain-containing protein n=1 Tax=Helicobacter bizzozeronii TaxID=56877 RepID=UPI000CF0A4E0|nr:DUF5644 domain-containing protein [Helicobacter bizzozeronii]